MAKQIKPLSTAQISRIKPQEKEYSIGDGDGLFLRVMPNGTKSWIFNYIHPTTKKRKNIGLGKYPEITLASAREKKREMRTLVAEGIDPKTHRDNQLVSAQIAQTSTLLAIAREWIEVKKHDITPDYADDIWRSLERHIFPNLGNLPIDGLTAPIVIQNLRTVEAKGALETVKRVCQRLNEIMNYAVNCGRLQSNPLSGIKFAFKKPKSTHMLTIKPEQLGELMRAMSLANIKHVTRCAFEFQLHTLTRPVECARAEWNEIDFENEIWTIPKEKMKKNRDHKIPMSPEALKLLEFMKKISFGQKYVFPSDRNPGSHLNSQSVNMALKRAGMEGILVSHGLRSIGSTALNEQGFNIDAIEVCLSHVDKNTIRSAYNKAEYIEERRQIMNWWSNYIITETKNYFSLATCPILIK
ncbi:tyrosine-type recombinase/integrase [Shewanella sp. FJAT-51649]|uniref:integrase domain-containing protein n=1 Tax=Shewanella sp. FJAT-51649 TaxID=2864210 RepID=UPI001C6580F2|nr:integrase domain-containing protein [Shewanella sp. FJAT-51649]QYJ70304.1 tyrosine-type recombinase/integrase [Shewanella sp. FJAT-51649]